MNYLRKFFEIREWETLENIFYNTYIFTLDEIVFALDV